MTTDLELDDSGESESMDKLFTLLDTADRGDQITVPATQDIDVALWQYQIERNYELTWERIGSGEPVIQIVKDQPLDDAALLEFDVRDLPPQKRHQVLLEAFDTFDPGDGFVLVNDHDPKPLYHELRSTRGDTFEWEYRSREPQEWVVEIVKTKDSEPADEDVMTRFDVRSIPTQERHPTIHHRYGMIPDGATMEIVASHEPHPLRQEFRQQYGQSFSWDVVESEPGRCRVQITKADVSDTEAGVSDTEAGVGDAESATAENGTDTEGDAMTVVRELDVRNLPPAQRHEKIFEEYSGLQRGEMFVLVNDHDPKPLYHQFEAEAGDEFYWEYQQKEPGEFRVNIGKADDGSSPEDAPGVPF